MKIISISGLDGSGKSTQIELLRKHFVSHGKKVFYFHAVQFSVPQILSALLSKVFATHRINEKTKYSKEKRGVTQASWSKIQLRKIALFVDLIRFKSLVKRLEQEKYDFILSDRYFYDNLINIAYLEKTNDLQLTTSNNILKPDHAFYLQADVSEIVKRDRVPDQGMEYLKIKKRLFDEAASIWNLKTIDGNRSKEEIFEEILKVISHQ